MSIPQVPDWGVVDILAWLTKNRKKLPSAEALAVYVHQESINGKTLLGYRKEDSVKFGLIRQNEFEKILNKLQKEDLKLQKDEKKRQRREKPKNGDLDSGVDDMSISETSESKRTINVMEGSSSANTSGTASFGQMSVSGGSTHRHQFDQSVACDWEASDGEAEDDACYIAPEEIHRTNSNNSQSEFRTPGFRTFIMSTNHYEAQIKIKGLPTSIMSTNLYEVPIEVKDVDIQPSNPAPPSRVAPILKPNVYPEPDYEDEALYENHTVGFEDKTIDEDEGWRQDDEDDNDNEDFYMNAEPEPDSEEDHKEEDHMEEDDELYLNIDEGTDTPEEVPVRPPLAPDPSMGGPRRPLQPPRKSSVTPPPITPPKRGFEPRVGTKPDISRETKPDINPGTKPTTSSLPSPPLMPPKPSILSRVGTKPDIFRETKPDINPGTKPDINPGTKPNAGILRETFSDNKPFIPQNKPPVIVFPSSNSGNPSGGGLSIRERAELLKTANEKKEKEPEKSHSSIKDRMSMLESGISGSFCPPLKNSAPPPMEDMKVNVKPTADLLPKKSSFSLPKPARETPMPPSSAPFGAPSGAPLGAPGERKPPRNSLPPPSLGRPQRKAPNLLPSSNLPPPPFMTYGEELAVRNSYEDVTISPPPPSTRPPLPAPISLPPTASVSRTAPPCFPPPIPEPEDDSLYQLEEDDDLYQLEDDEDPDNIYNDGEDVDPVLGYVPHILTRLDAEELLRNDSRSSCFLVRDSSTNPDYPHVISLKVNDSFEHARLGMRQNGDIAIGTVKRGEVTHESLSALIRFYCKTPMNLLGRSVVLVNPVTH